MKPLAFLLTLCLAAPLWAQDSEDRYTINADTVRQDDVNDVTTYEGNAKAEVADVMIQAESISIFRDDGLPVKIEANGNPVRFHRKAPAEQLDGTAQKIVFSVPDMKLMLFDYVVADASGNDLKGKKATFELKP